MAKVILGKEQRLADRIIRCLPKQKIIAEELGISKQMVSYKINHKYPDELVEIIKVLKLAGYEVIESEKV